MKRLADFPRANLARIRGVLTDVDGTLTTGPCVTASTYAAVEALHAKGMLVIPITGGPAGMCMTMARMWPVSAVIGESGAFYFRHQREQKRMFKRFWYNEQQRAKHRAIIQQARDEILREVPNARLAADQAYREDDLAVDWAEDVGPLTDSEVHTIKRIMKSHGLHAHQSSIHVNGWIGDYSKLAMTRLLLKEQYNVDLNTQADEFIYVGDAPNDSAMFEYFRWSIGVANIVSYGTAVTHLPQFVTQQGFGAGFEEVAALLLAR